MARQKGQPRDQLFHISWRFRRNEGLKVEDPHDRWSTLSAGLDASDPAANVAEVGCQSVEGVAVDTGDLFQLPRAVLTLGSRCHDDDLLLTNTEGDMRQCTDASLPSIQSATPS